MVSPYDPVWWPKVPEHEKDYDKFHALMVKFRIGALTGREALWLDKRVDFYKTFHDDDMCEHLTDIARAAYKRGKQQGEWC